VKTCCHDIKGTLKRDGQSDIDANDLCMELGFLQDFIREENMGLIEILNFF
jgi:hypothetical protein